jgi:chromosome segregation ATPase
VREQLHKAEVEKTELRQAVDRLSQAVGQGAQELSRVRIELDSEKGRRQDADRRVSEVETAKRETERRLTELQDRISGLSWWKKLLIGKQS